MVHINVQVSNIAQKRLNDTILFFINSYVFFTVYLCQRVLSLLNQPKAFLCDTHALLNERTLFADLYHL